MDEKIFQIIRLLLSAKSIPDNKTRTKSALISLSEEIENVADKVSQSVVSIHSRTRGNGSGLGVSLCMNISETEAPVSKVSKQVYCYGSS